MSEPRESHEFRINTRNRLFKEQNGKCAYCGKPIKGKPSLDHIIPVILGAELYQKDNYIVTCIKCNKAKGDHIVFTNLYDRIIYPIVDIPYFAQWDYIQTNKFKEK